MTARSRSGWLLLVAIVLGALLSGCVSLPDSSSVQRGRGAGVHRSSSLVINHPPGPRPGADKTSIVEHYIQAMLSFPLAPDVVRQFFTPAAARSWVPSQQLRVYENPVVTGGPSGTVSLRAKVLGSLDDRGSWVSASSSADALDVALELTKVAGEWRISNPPPGTLLDTDFFARYYHQYSLYYFDPSHTLLTPDAIYLLLGNAAQTSNALVRNLLRGPTAAMGGVVSGEVPPGTRLTGDVTVSESGLAEVPLSSQVLSMSAQRLRYLAAQLAWTLRQERLGVNHVRMTAAGHVVTVPGLDESFAVDAFQGYDPTIFAAKRTLYALSSEGHLVSVTPDSAFAVAGPIGALPARASSAGVNPSGSRAAVVTRGGSRVVVGDIIDGEDAAANAVWLSGGSGLLKPSWDVHDLLWLVDRPDGRARVHVVAGVGTRVVDNVVNAPGISGEDVRAFAMSRDGMRAAVIIGSGTDAKLVVASVRRSATSRMDVSLTNVRDIADADFPLMSLTSVAWYTPTTLMVVAQDEGSDPQPYQIAVDGSRVQPTTGFLPIRPTYLAAGSDADVPPVIGSSDGRLYSRTPDQQWPLLPTRQRLFAPTYVG
ncbi:MAG: LpqB family beta-propeller domain-containing protein [Nocardioidaceae bacterium]